MRLRAGPRGLPQAGRAKGDYLADIRFKNHRSSILESNRVKNGVGYWYGPRKQPRQLASTVVKNQFDRKLSEVER